VVNKLKTRVTEKLGIPYPLFMGTMGYHSDAELVAAATNAGAFTCLSSILSKSSKELRDEIRKTKSLTDRPFGVNINLFPMVSPVPNEEYIDVILEEGITVIETAGRSPEPYMKQIRQKNIILIHKCARVRDARKAESLGADLVEIVGFECAGHPSREGIGSIVLIPQVVDAVKLPVIAGGGIGDARGFLAALALGAEGVIMGTRFLATKECPIHPNLKQRLIEATETDSMLTMYSKGDPMRALRNNMALKVYEMEQNGATWEDIFALIGAGKGKTALAMGESEDTILACGQVVGQIHDIPTMKEFIDRLMNNVMIIHQRISSMFDNRNYSDSHN